MHQAAHPFFSPSMGAAASSQYASTTPPTWVCGSTAYAVQQGSTFMHDPCTVLEA